MASLNKTMIIGNLGKDPEIRYSQQGLAVCNFSVATTDYWIDKNTGERQEKTEWHRIVAFGKQAETLEKYLKKGSSVFIEGRLQTRSWEKDGQTHYTTEIVVSNFQFVGGRQDNQGGTQSGYQNTQNPANTGNSYGTQQNRQAPEDKMFTQNQYQQPQQPQGQQPVPDDDIPF